MKRRIFPSIIVWVLIPTIPILLVGAIVLANFLIRGHPSPDQPIAFPHDWHAGSLQVQCIYCHRAALVSNSSGVPPVELCMGCHKVVGDGKPEVEKLRGYWERGEPIGWVKVWDLPDHARFPHQRHISAGLDCTECHGDVAGMKQIERARYPHMGWCLECHRERGATEDCWRCHK